MQELATIYAVHPNMIALWKKQLVERASMIFEKEGKDKEAEAAERTQDELFRQIGQLQVENEFLKKLQTAVWERTEAIEPEHPELSIGRQCELLGVSRSVFYYRPKEEKEDPDLAILTAILAVMHEKPFYGYRKIARALAAMGVTRKQVRRIMHTAGLRAIYPGKQLSKPSKGCKKYPYLLRGKTIWLPNQVWASDITYLRLSGGYVYLVTIIDLYSRKILSWSISNTMDEQFCVAALEEAIARYEVPGIFNTVKGVSSPLMRFSQSWKPMEYRSVWIV